MYRQAMPYRRGGAGAPGAEADEGLMFVAVAAKDDEVEMALRRMCGEFAHLTSVGKDSGHDNIFRISRATSGAYFYAPPLAELTTACGLPAPAPCAFAAALGIPEGGLSERVPGKMETSGCPNCVEQSTFRLPSGSDLAQCLLCRRLFRAEELGLPPPKL